VPPPWRGEKQVDAFGDIDHPVMTPSLDVVLQRSAANARNKLSFPKIRSGRIRAVRRIRPSSNAMVAIIYLLGTFIADLLKSRRRLEVENLFLRHQLNIILRRPPQRLRLRGSDRALMVWMTRLWPSLLALARVVQPATILRWHRAGFRTYWRWKSQGRRGRPTIEHELRDLIRRMSKENPLWGAPRIHGELLKLGFEVAESTVSKYMIGRRGPPSQSWRTFLRNHADAIAAIDLCVVPTLTFERLFAFLVVGHGRRQLLWFAVTRNPSAEWLAQQMAEAFPWNTAPTYLVRDNDRAYGHAFQRRIRAMGIRDRPISPRSPWQNPYAERLIGTLRRECLDHVLIVGERHLRRMLASYSSYYNESRTHLALEKDSPLRRAIQKCGAIITTPILSGLHHRYVRI
jgi:transposase InsO family protein